MPPRFSDPERLTGSHVLSGFDCGEESLNLWLEKYARTAGSSESARTFVVTDAAQDGRVVGYYSLAVASIAHDEATERAAKGTPKHEIPAVLLARLAVDRSVQRGGVGGFMLRDAMERALAVAENAAVRLMLVHALHDDARRFYGRFGFEPSPTDELNLQLLTKDIRASLSAATE